jgi:hypothetical protein
MAEEKPKHIKYVSWVGVITLTGCLGFITALLALVLGLWLDSLIGRRGPITICLLVLSVPLNLYLMVKVAFLLTHYLRPLNPNATTKDDEEV